MTYRLPCLSFILLFVMQDAGHCVSALRQIVFQAISIEGIDAEDDIGQPVFILIYADMGDVAVIAYEHLGDLTDRSQFVLDADRDAAPSSR